MDESTVTATHFKSVCLKLVDEVSREGKPVAKLVPVEQPKRRSTLGLLKGTVLSYDDPFEPAVPSEEWDAMWRSFSTRMF